MATYGSKLEFWRAKVQEGLPERFMPGRDNLLCDNQIKVHELGFREAGMCETIFGYSIRMASGIDNNERLFGGRMCGRIVLYEEALEWGKAWVDASPNFRALTYPDKCSGCTLNYHAEVEAK